MAQNSTDGRDVPPAPTYVCHTDQSVSTVICIICDAAYHRREFANLYKKNQGEFVTRNLIVCPRHNITPSFEADEVFTGDKKTIIELKKYIKSLQETKNDSASASGEAENSVENSGIDTDVDSYNENMQLRVFNEELRAHNTELREHNSFLRSLIKKDETPTFKDILINQRKSNHDKVENTNILVTSQIGNEQNIQKAVENEIVKSKLPVLKVKKAGKGKVVVACKDDTQAHKIIEYLDQNVKEALSIQKEEKQNPLLKIVNINYDFEPDELADDLCARNNISSEELEIVHMYGNNRVGGKSAIIKVTPELYSRIMNSGYIFAGFERCKVFDDFNINKCWKCGTFGHSGNKCQQPLCCAHCSGAHDTRNCTQKGVVTKCIICIRANKFLNKKRNIEHVAGDFQKCESYRSKWEKVVSMTNYPYRPSLPRPAREQTSTVR